MKRWLLGLTCCLVGAGFCADPAQDRTVVEALLRMENFNLAGSDKAVATVDRFLAANFASEEALRLVEKYELDRGDELLALALDKPSHTLGVRAARLLVGRDQAGRIVAALDQPATASAAIQLLRNLRDPGLAKSLPALAIDARVARPVRVEALKTLAELDPKRLLEHLDDFPDRRDALDLLLTHRDAAVRKQAAGLAGPGDDLGSLEALAKLRGDAVNGKAVYGRVCAVCHLPSSLNLDFGPNLSEIGTKLPRQGLFQAILEPNAGISFGYEAFEVTVKGGGGTFIGFAASQTDEVLGLRMPGGLTQEFKQADIEINKLPASLMPEGLAATMSKTELVDLVEYLTTLRKP